MQKIKFEYRISLAYLIIGVVWILLSDNLVDIIIVFVPLSLTTLQTIKGWFYVITTALILFFFIKKHLGRLRTTEAELERHRLHLAEIVNEKTVELDAAVVQLKQTNDKLKERNKFIDIQNQELKQAINELRITQSQLAQADRMTAIGVFTEGLAYELNKPLKTIADGIDSIKQLIMSNSAGSISIGVHEEQILSSIQRIKTVVSGLKQLSSNQYSARERCNLHTIIDNCIAILNYHLTERIQVERDFWDEELTVSGNPGQLHQAIISILINAVQAINGDGIIRIESKLSDNLIRIKISDTGCGIDEINIKHVTDPFFTTKEPGSGTGLGLSISYSILKNHNGDLTIESEKNKGTTVTISLPQQIQQ